MQKCLLCLYLALFTHAANAFERMYFGSCSHQDKDIPIFSAIIEKQPELFIFLGDNIYGDTEDMQVLSAKYQKLAAKPLFQALRSATDVIAIWDDHDYGENDAGAHYPQKEASRKLMLDFWGEPENSPRRHRPDGIYTAYEYGEPGQTIRVILPDLRWNRPDIASVSKFEYLAKRMPAKQGPYLVHPDPQASMLGETQWQWLEQELKKPAQLRIIGSSIQMLSDFTGWEAWQNFPADLARLKHLIKKHKINGVILLSGDTHWGEISYFDEALDYPLWEITSSGLTEKWKDVSPNKHRVGQYTHQVNFGGIEIDWTRPDPLISLGLFDVKGDIIQQHRIRLSSISPYQKR